MKKLMMFFVTLALAAALPAQAGNKHKQRPADLNRDGKISIEERGAAKQQAFMAFDADRNGVVSLQEVMQYKKNPEEAKEKLAKFDANHDGQVSSVEVSDKINARIARHNARHSGQPSRGPGALGH